MSILDEKLEKANTICILGHQTPDGDCIGSALAVYNYVQNKYNDKQVKIYLEEFSDKFLVLPNADKISHATNDATRYDLCIIVDCGSAERLKDYKVYMDTAKEIMVFDHHENDTINADVMVVNEKAIANCEVLYDYFDENYIDKNVAICLYIGIATDSGVFRYRATSPRTFEIVAKLIKYDFNFTELLDTIVFDNTLNQRRAQALAFNRIKYICGGRVAYSYLDQRDMEKLGVTRNDIDNIIVYLREITGIKVAVFAYAIGTCNNIFKFSLRSKYDDIDVGEFARENGGGGHKLAAGMTFKGNIDLVSLMLENNLTAFLDRKE